MLLWAVQEHVYNTTVPATCLPHTGFAGVWTPATHAESICHRTIHNSLAFLAKPVPFGVVPRRAGRPGEDPKGPGRFLHISGQWAFLCHGAGRPEPGAGRGKTVGGGEAGEGVEDGQSGQQRRIQFSARGRRPRSGRRGEIRRRRPGESAGEGRHGLRPPSLWGIPTASCKLTRSGCAGAARAGRRVDQPEGAALPLCVWAVSAAVSAAVSKTQ